MCSFALLLVLRLTTSLLFCVSSLVCVCFRVARSRVLPTRLISTSRPLHEPVCGLNLWPLVECSCRHESPVIMQTTVLRRAQARFAEVVRRQLATLRSQGVSRAAAAQRLLQRIISPHESTPSRAEVDECMRALSLSRDDAERVLLVKREVDRLVKRGATPLEAFHKLRMRMAGVHPTPAMTCRGGGAQQARDAGAARSKRPAPCTDAAGSSGSVPVHQVKRQRQRPPSDDTGEASAESSAGAGADLSSVPAGVRPGAEDGGSDGGNSPVGRRETKSCGGQQTGDSCDTVDAGGALASPVGSVGAAAGGVQLAAAAVKAGAGGHDAPCTKRAIVRVEDDEAGAGTPPRRRKRPRLAGLP